jgi:hypothetical protein
MVGTEIATPWLANALWSATLLPEELCTALACVTFDTVIVAFTVAAKRRPKGDLFPCPKRLALRIWTRK